MTHGYREDLAYIHDVGFGHFAKSAAPVVLKLLRQHRKTGGLVVVVASWLENFARPAIEFSDSIFRLR